MIIVTKVGINNRNSQLYLNLLVRRFTTKQYNGVFFTLKTCKSVHYKIISCVICLTDCNILKWLNIPKKMPKQCIWGLRIIPLGDRRRLGRVKVNIPFNKFSLCHGTVHNRIVIVTFKMISSKVCAGH